MTGPDDRSQEENPYAPPDVPVGAAAGPEVPAEIQEAERIRRDHINHEWSIRAIGGLNVIGSAILIAAAFLIGAGGLEGVEPDAPLGPGRVAVAAVLAFFGGIGLVAGIGLRMLRNWARWLTSSLIALSLLSNLVSLVLSAVATGNPAPDLIGFVVSSLIPFYFLYLLLSPKGRMVCSPEYQEIIARTPHVKYRMSCLIKGLGILLLVLLGLGIVGFFFAAWA